MLNTLCILIIIVHILFITRVNLLLDAINHQNKDEKLVYNLIYDICYHLIEFVFKSQQRGKTKKNANLIKR